MEQPGRRHPARGVHSESGEATIVFLTVCTKARAPWLASEEAHETLLAAWDGAKAWSVGRYVLMPDHLHLFCAPYDLEVALEKWIRFWKTAFRNQINNEDCRWQTDHWDTRLRLGENYAEKWEYVRQNPVRAGLVERADDWPYQGECHHLSW